MTQRARFELFVSAVVKEHAVIDANYFLTITLSGKFVDSCSVPWLLALVVHLRTKMKMKMKNLKMTMRRAKQFRSSVACNSTTTQRTH